MNTSFRGVFLSAAVVLSLSVPMSAWAESQGLETARRDQEVEKLKQEIDHSKKQMEHIDTHLIHRPETRLARVLNGMEFGFGLTGIVQGAFGAADLAGRDRHHYNPGTARPGALLIHRLFDKKEV